jgi:protein SCO1/2
MNRKTWLYIAFFVFLFAGFVFAMTRVIPGFGEVKMPVLSKVQPFRFVDQEGKEFTEQQVAGKVYVAEYFFTTCPAICPKMNRNMKIVYDAYKDEAGFLILSHSVDPETDNIGRMKAYADSLGVNGHNWHFLTGSKDSLYMAARVSYLLDDPKNNNTRIEDQFIHTQFFALVDKSGRVRRIYDGLKKDEINNLIKDISELLKEKETDGARFANGLFNNNPQ